MAKTKLKSSIPFSPINRMIALADYQPHKRNYNRHPASQVERIAKSLQKFGQVRSVVVWRNYFLAGHGVREAALSLGWDSLRADVLPDEYPETLALAYVAADNELGRLSDPDQAQLAQILTEARAYDEELLQAIGYDEAEFKKLLAEVGGVGAGGAGSGSNDTAPEIDRAEELGAKWKTADGQIWRIGDHVVICGDCREPATWQRLLQAADVDKVNGVFTSPPYAMQRKDQYGGVPTNEYVDWWEALQANVRANLASDGSFFVNIKAHCEDGQRVLYCMDLVCSMVRRWGWRFVDELCWRKAKDGYPGDYPNRFRDAFEPIYHFSADKAIKFTKWNVAHKSDSAFKYSRGNKSQSSTGSGFGLNGAGLETGEGLALPSNVLEIGEVNPDEALSQAAMFPVALPDFFIRAYSDPGDVWIDPFLGSGTTIVAAHNNKRRGLGSEKLPKYLGVILERLQAHVGVEPELLTDA